VQVSPHPAQALNNAPCGTRYTPRRAYLYVTLLEPTTEHSEAAPARALHSGDISALRPLVLGDDGYDASPALTLPHNPGSRPQRCWQSQLNLTGVLPSWRMSLRCSGSFAHQVTHVPAGYCGQHRRSCHFPAKCITVTATTSCRTRTHKLTCRGAATTTCRAKP
jgi:hypothetical protein